MGYPAKTGNCEIRGCCRTPTEWHHVISKNQIEKRGLHQFMYTDPGNLKEYCRYHHNMTTASMVHLHLLRAQARITLADYCD